MATNKLMEAAAEILAGSKKAATAEPMHKSDAQVVDLGGPKVDDSKPTDDSNKIDATKAAKSATAPTTKPSGASADDQNKPVGGKKTMGEEEVKDEEVIAEEDETEVTADLSDEELAEAKKDWMKKKVAEHKGSMKEDVDALFNGESLSEDFRVKATLIFESAVTSRVETILEDVLSDNDKVLEEAIDAPVTIISVHRPSPATTSSTQATPAA